MVDTYHSMTQMRKMDEALLEKKAEYEALIQEASKAYLAKLYHKAVERYHHALTIAIELKTGKMILCVLRYMICYCLLESNSLNDLSEAVMTLQTIEKSLKHRFPAIYCLLAQAHCKLYRFDKALETITEGDAIFNKNQKLEVFYVPGTNIGIQNMKDETWLKVKEECTAWHKPDAICSLLECNHITRPYVTPEKNIFKSDPAFTGMVVVHCNNNQQSCSLTFHPDCWKYKKDQLYPINKVSDKDMLGNTCFTPNCMNDDIHCLVSSIEVIGQNGEVKAQIKEATSVSWPVHKNLSKGAIKKVKPPAVKKTGSTAVTPSKQHILVTPKRKPHVKKQLNRYDGYDENQLLEITDYSNPNVDFSNESVGVAGEKAFLFSFFYQYIQNNLVRVCDLYSKFTEINQDCTLKDLDILTFLLETNKIAVVDQNTGVFSDDVGDIVDDLMNDDECDDYSKKNHNNNVPDGNLHDGYQTNCTTNTCNANYNYEAAGGDASSHFPSTDIKTDVDFDNKLEKRGTENRKLKEYITKLENVMKEMMEENCRLKSEIKDFRKEQEGYLKQMEECEALYETMTDFQKRYENIKDDNLRMKEEIIGLIKDKKELEDKLLSLNNPETKRQELKKTFQEEYKILQECITSKWEKKTETLEESLKAEIEAKKSLLNQCLNSQYSANKHLLNGYLDQCTVALEIIGKINNWMEKTMNVTHFKDNSEWMDRLNFLQKATADLQSEYSSLLEKLYSEGPDTTSLTEISLESPTIPSAPSENLGDVVQNALNAFYTSCQLKNFMTAQRQQQQHQTAMYHQMQAARATPYAQQYPQHQRYPPDYMYAQQTIVHPMLGTQIVNYPVPRANGAITQQHQQQQPVTPTKATGWWSVRGSEQVPLNDQIPSFESNVQIKELLTPDNLSVKSEPTSSTPISKRELKYDQYAEDTKPVEVKNEDSPKPKPTPEEFKTEHRILMENLDSSLNRHTERIAEIRVALNSIVFSARKKAMVDEEEKKRGQPRQDPAEQLRPAIEDGAGENRKEEEEEEELVVVQNGGMQPERIREDRSDAASVATSADGYKPRKKVGVDQLIQLMQQKYPGALELDIVEILSEIRKKHNDSLTGTSVKQILDEFQECFLRTQHLHMLRYFLNDEVKLSNGESSAKLPGSNQQNVHKETISPASSSNSLNRSDINTVQKKTWNKLPQEEVKWIASGEKECSICMALVQKRNCYTLSCQHSFHTECIKPWLKFDRSCPNCRIAVTETDDFPPLPS